MGGRLISQDPYTALAAVDDAQVSAFLRSISRSAAAPGSSEAKELSQSK